VIMNDILGFLELCAVFILVFGLVIGGGILFFWMI